MVEYHLYIEGTERYFNTLTVSWNLDSSDIPTWEAVLSYADEDVSREDIVEIYRKNAVDSGNVSIFKGIVEYIQPSMDSDGNRMRIVGGRHNTVKLWRKWAERNTDNPSYWSDFYPHKIIQFLIRSIRSDKPRQVEDKNWTRVGWGKYGKSDFKATASGYAAGYEPWRIFNFYALDGWKSSTSNQNGQWIRIDLGASYTIAGIRATCWNSQNYLRGYTVETSTNGSDWTTKATQSTNKARNIVESWTPTSVRYIRITGTVTTSVPAEIGDIYIYEGTAISGISAGTMEEYLPFNCSEIISNASSGDTHVHVRHSFKFQPNDEIRLFDGTGNEVAKTVTTIDGETDTINFSGGIGFGMSTSNGAWVANFTFPHVPQINFDYLRRTDAIAEIIKNCITVSDDTWDWWVTDDGEVHFESERGTDKSATINFQYASNIMDTEHKLDNTNKIDSVMVLGRKNNKDGNLQDVNASDWIGTGDYEFVVTDEESESEAASISKAYQILEKASKDEDKLKIQIDDETYTTGSWGIGDYVTVTDSATGVTGSYRITAIKRSYSPDGEKVQLQASSTKFTIGRAIERIFREAKYNSMHMDSDSFGRDTTIQPGFYLFYEAERLAFDANTVTKQVMATSSGGAHLIMNSDVASGYMFGGPNVAIKAGEYQASFYMKVGDNTSGSQIAGINLYSNTAGVNFGELVVLGTDFTTADTWQEFKFTAIVDAEYDDLEFRCYFYTGITDLYCDWVGLRSGQAQIEDYMDNPAGPPAAPTGLIAADNPISVRLTWAANTEFDLDHYNVYKNTVDTFATATKIGEADVNMWLYPALVAEYNTTLWFWVTAVDWVGYGYFLHPSSGCWHRNGENNRGWYSK